MNDKTPTRTIHTGLYSDYAKEILNSVHGQLSDGMWENSRGYDKYWTNFDVKVEVDGEITFHVNTEWNNSYCGHWTENPFKNMTDAQFKQWYAGKLKAVIMQELRDNGIKKGWNRRNMDFKSHYLNYHLDINVADIYCVYDQLLGRMIGVTRYDTSTMSRVLGHKRTEDEIAEETAKRDKVAAVELEYKKIREAAAAKENEEIEAVRQRWREYRDAEYKKYAEALKAARGETAA